MLITVYLYKDGMEIYKYNGGGFPAIKLVKFPEKLQSEVLKILNSFRDKNERMNIHTYTSELSTKEAHE